MGATCCKSVVEHQVDELQAFLEGLLFWSDINADETVANHFLECITRQTFSAGDEICNEKDISNDKLYIIMRGTATLSSSSLSATWIRGEYGVIGRVAPAASATNTADVPNTPLRYTATAKTDMVVASCDINALAKLLKERAALANNLVPYLGHTEEVLSSANAFRNWSHRHLAMLAAFAEYRRYSAMDIVLEEGKPQQHLYIIVRGSITHDVRVPNSSTPFTCDVLHEGDVFGVDSILFDVISSMRVVASSNLIVLRIEKQYFDMIYKELTDMEVQLLKTIARRQCIQSLRKYDKFFTTALSDLVNEVSDLFHFVIEEPNTNIIHEGDIGDALYVTVHGTLNIFVSQKCVSQLRPGDYFGEVALLRDDFKRSADVKTSSKCILLTLQREYFTQFIELAPSAMAEFEVRLMKDKVSLRGLLHHQLGYMYFLAHCRNEMSSENVAFWTKCKEYRMKATNVSHMSTTSFRTEYQDLISTSNSDTFDLRLTPIVLETNDSVLQLQVNAITEIEYLSDLCTEHAPEQGNYDDDSTKYFTAEGLTRMMVMLGLEEKQVEGEDLVQLRNEEENEYLSWKGDLGVTLVSQGVPIFHVLPGKLGDSIGLKPNDIIVAVNEVQVTSTATFMTALISLENARSIAVQVLRKGSNEPITLSGPMQWEWINNPNKGRHHLQSPQSEDEQNSSHALLATNLANLSDMKTVNLLADKAHTKSSHMPDGLNVPEPIQITPGSKQRSLIDHKKSPISSVRTLPYLASELGISHEVDAEISLGRALNEEYERALRRAIILSSAVKLLGIVYAATGAVVSSSTIVTTRMGIRTGDVILAINGKTVSDAESCIICLSKLPIGYPVLVTVKSIKLVTNDDDENNKQEQKMEYNTRDVTVILGAVDVHMDHVIRVTNKIGEVRVKKLLAVMLAKRSDISSQILIQNCFQQPNKDIGVPHMLRDDFVEAVIQPEYFMSLMKPDGTAATQDEIVESLMTLGEEGEDDNENVRIARTQTLGYKLVQVQSILQKIHTACEAAGASTCQTWFHDADLTQEQRLTLREFLSACERISACVPLNVDTLPLRFHQMSSCLPRNSQNQRCIDLISFTEFVLIEKIFMEKFTHYLKILAVQIYEEYICPTAACQVNLSNMNSYDIQIALSEKNKNIGPLLFQQAENEIYRLMESDSYERFKRSGAFEAFLESTGNYIHADIKSTTTNKKVFDRTKMKSPLSDTSVSSYAPSLLSKPSSRDVISPLGNFIYSPNVGNGARLSIAIDSREANSRFAELKKLTSSDTSQERLPLTHASASDDADAVVVERSKDMMMVSSAGDADVMNTANDGLLQQPLSEDC